MEYNLKNDIQIEVRDVTCDDVQLLLDYMDKIHLQTKNLMREPEEWTMTFEEEYKFVQSVLKSDSQEFIIAMYQGRIISAAGFKGDILKRVKHRVSLGISILSEFRGLGLGTIIMNVLIQKAIKLGKKKIDLQVREDNKNAISLYEKVGFEHEGVIKDGFFVDERYINLVVMGLVLRRKL